MRKPQLMGVVNLTPDSFYKASRFSTPQQALDAACAMVEAGAEYIDLGVEATNPAKPELRSSAQKELDRLLPVLELMSKHVSVTLSVDTSHPEVMSAAVQAGATLINDVRALRHEGALEVAAALNVPVCLMYKGAAPDKTTVIRFFEERISACVRAGMQRERLIIDPGIGAGHFGKTTEQSLRLIRELSELKSFRLPVLVGVSRKTFIGALLNQPPDARLAGSLGASVVAMLNGADIIRTHDVAETAHALNVAHAIVGGIT